MTASENNMFKLFQSPEDIDQLSEDKREEFETELIEYLLQTKQFTKVVEELTGGVASAVGRLLTGFGGQVEGDSYDSDEDGLPEDEDEVSTIDIPNEPGCTFITITSIYDGNRSLFKLDEAQTEDAIANLKKNQVVIQLHLSATEAGEKGGNRGDYLIGFDGQFTLKKVGSNTVERFATFKDLDNHLDMVSDSILSSLEMFKIENSLSFKVNGKLFTVCYENRPPSEFLGEYVAILLQTHIVEKQALPETYGIKSKHGESLCIVATMENDNIVTSLYLNDKYKNKGKDYYLLVNSIQFTDSEYDVSCMEVFKDKKSIGTVKTKEELVKVLQ